MPDTRTPIEKARAHLAELLENEYNETERANAAEEHQYDDVEENVVAGNENYDFDDMLYAAKASVEADDFLAGLGYKGANAKRFKDDYITKAMFERAGQHQQHDNQGTASGWEQEGYWEEEAPQYEEEGSSYSANGWGAEATELPESGNGYGHC